MIAAVAFLAVAGIGAVARAEAIRRWNRPGGLALGTVLVNVSGSFLVGLLSAAVPPLVTVLGVGALGAYTTFSAFAAEALALIDRRRSLLAAAYVTGSLLAGVGAAALGLAMSAAP